MIEEAVKSPISVLPANGQCSFERGRDPSGKRIICQRKATMRINGVALCDQHAELSMMAGCGRNTKITRAFSPLQSIHSAPLHLPSAVDAHTLVT